MKPPQVPQDKSLRFGIAGLYFLIVLPIVLFILTTNHTQDVVIACWLAIVIPEMVILLIWWNDIQPP